MTFAITAFSLYQEPYVLVRGVIITKRKDANKDFSSGVFQISRLFQGLLTHEGK